MGKTVHQAVERKYGQEEEVATLEVLAWEILFCILFIIVLAPIQIKIRTQIWHFFCDTGVEHRACVCRKTLYYLSHSASPFCVGNY
jgi:hypothetical protein